MKALRTLPFIRPGPLLVLGWLVLLVAPIIGWAQSVPQRPLDVMLVLDNSGSMKKNDPHSLMSKAVSEFAGQLPDDSRLGIVIFDHAVRMTLELASKADAGFQAQVAEGLKGIDYRGRWTDIPGAIERAIYALRTRARPDAQRLVILFTDGVVETGNPAKDVERARWLKENLAAEAKQVGIRIFGIAFTEGADFQLLQSVSQVTAGEHLRVLAASDIAAVFERVRSRIQELREDEVRKIVEATPPDKAVISSDTSWMWTLGLVFLLGAAGLVVWRSRTRPALTGGLRDIGGHTGKVLHPLRTRLIHIGRDAAKNDVVIAEDTVSSQHALIEIRDGTFYLRDLRSANGSFINGKKMSDPDAIRESALKHGDRIRFDAFEFEFAIDGLASVAAGPQSDGSDVTPGGTRLRGYPAEGHPAPALGLKPPASPISAAVGATPKTDLKTGRCYNHPSWDAIAACPKCRREKCATCMLVRDGVEMCTDCAAAEDSARLSA